MTGASTGPKARLDDPPPDSFQAFSCRLKDTVADSSMAAHGVWLPPNAVARLKDRLAPGLWRLWFDEAEGTDYTVSYLVRSEMADAFRLKAESFKTPEARAFVAKIVQMREMLSRQSTATRGKTRAPSQYGSDFRPRRETANAIAAGTYLWLGDRAETAKRLNAGMLNSDIGCRYESHHVRNALESVAKRHLRLFTADSDAIIAARYALVLDLVLWSDVAWQAWFLDGERGPAHRRSIYWTEADYMLRLYNDASLSASRVRVGDATFEMAFGRFVTDAVFPVINAMNRTAAAKDPPKAPPVIAAATA